MKRKETNGKVRIENGISVSTMSLTQIETDSREPGISHSLSDSSPFIVVSEDIYSIYLLTALLDEFRLGCLLRLYISSTALYPTCRYYLYDVFGEKTSNYLEETL